ncbi:hypothetical protein [Guptibacillus hwajinpoensis]|uniref:hypothetical protein n=1 Tax=Guptibacillus hwajinpoensis TaxID=208199 RepID=UPI001CFD31B0|nr:hypothetical protein [Pseudalkalibacillus hwajinpoensis]WLR59179.1 hypothetical protein LC071_18865 [Pseudalkalibacillus hwajinpoensis]
MNRKENEFKELCDGCVCDFLRCYKPKLSDMLYIEEKLFTLVKENGLKIPNLRFVSFDPKTCCATFKNFSESSIEIWDCSKLAGIICQNVPPIPPQPPVDCQCSATITAGNSGTPEVFANNDVTFLVPGLDSRNIQGRINICPDCTLEGSVFNFMVPPLQGILGFRFESNVITNAVCALENSMLTVTGVGTAQPIGNSGLDGVFRYELILMTGTPGTIAITLRDINDIVVFQTAPFPPSIGAGKMVEIVECE